MLKTSDIKTGEATATGYLLENPGGEGHPNMIVVQCQKGYLMCGYLNMDAAEKFGDAAVLVGGAGFDEVLKNQIKGATSKARELGIKDGMTGLEAAELLNA